MADITRFENLQDNREHAAKLLRAAHCLTLAACQMQDGSEDQNLFNKKAIRKLMKASGDLHEECLALDVPLPRLNSTDYVDMLGWDPLRASIRQASLDKRRGSVT